MQRINKYKIFLILSILCFSLYFISCKHSANNSKAIEIKELTNVWKEISLVYVDNYKKHRKIDSLYFVYLNKMLNTKNEDYLLLIESFTNEIHDGHTRYHLPKNYIKDQYSVPILTEYVNGKYRVSAFGEKLKDKVSLGDIIIKVNNKNIDDYILENVYPNNFCTEYSYKYTLANKIFSGIHEEVFKIELKDNNGNKKIIEVKTSTNNNVYYKRIPKIINNLSNSISLKEMGNIAYIKIPTFRTDIASQFKKIIDTLKTFDNIIFDLRGNRGGSSTDGEISQCFSNEDSIPLFSIKYKVVNCKSLAYGSLNNPNVKAFLNIPKEYSNKFSEDEFNCSTVTKQMKRMNSANPKGILSSKNVIILTDYNTASAAESFIIEFKAIGKGFCIGQPTYGSSTMPAFYPLPSGAVLSISTIWTNYYDGSKFSNINPDILIDPTIKDYQNNNDTILKVALKYFCDLETRE